MLGSNDTVTYSSEECKSTRDPDSNWSDDNDDDDDGLRYQSYECINDDGDVSDEDSIGNGQVSYSLGVDTYPDPLDILEAEYQACIRAESNVDRTNEILSTSSGEVCHEESEQEDMMKNEKNELNCEGDGELIRDGEDNIVDSSREIPKSDMKVDVSAVREAMNNLRLKHPTFSSRLDKNIKGLWSERKVHNQLPPPNVSQKFKEASNSCDRSQVEYTARMSRSATMAYAVSKVFDRVQYKCANDEKQYVKSNGTLRIHVIGCDIVECTNKDSILQTFLPFIEWMFEESPARYPKLKEIDLILVGPGIPANISTRFNHLKPIKIKSMINRDVGISSARISCATCTYEEYENGDRKTYPDIIFAFNAGIWGYSDWLPTLSFVASWSRTATPVVVTSYTSEEGSDDEDTISDHLKFLGLESRSLWHSEKNPFGSRKERETLSAISGRLYRENSFWQCWLLGDSGHFVNYDIPNTK
mmetsp:Transcript_19692/g.25527  ORF Transcript_19692/g.25527 Transcript_19692/m.25527 type:complete len:473 (+) Transcript_19692:71-1489(+)